MTRRDLRRYLIAYDIADDSRRDRLAKCLQRHGDRVQFSVFVVDASPTRILRLRNEIDDIVDTAADSVLFCDLGLTQSSDEPRFSFIGRSPHITGGRSRVV